MGRALRLEREASQQIKKKVADAWDFSDLHPPPVVLYFAWGECPRGFWPETHADNEDIMP